MGCRTGLLSLLCIVFLLGLIFVDGVVVVVTPRDARTAGIAQPGINVGALAARLHVASVCQILFGYLEGQRAGVPNVARLGRNGYALVTLPRLDLVDIAQLLGVGHVLQHLGDGQDVDVGSVSGQRGKLI